MTNFYRPLSNCQPHHTVQIFVVSTTVLTMTTTHNTVPGATASTKRTTLPLPGKGQCTHPSTVNVHNARPIDSAHFAQPMSYNTTYRSTSLVHLCNDSPASSTCIASYIRRQYVRTVPNVDIAGSSICHTRHLATGGVAGFNYVLVTNSNPVTTCASDGGVNPYPNRRYEFRTGASTRVQSSVGTLVLILCTASTRSTVVHGNWTLANECHCVYIQCGRAQYSIMRVS